MWPGWRNQPGHGWQDSGEREDERVSDETGSHSDALMATSGTPPYTWSVPSGGLPAGLSLSAPEPPPEPGTYEWYRKAWIQNGDLGALAMMTNVPLPQPEQQP